LALLFLSRRSKWEKLMDDRHQVILQACAKYGIAPDVDWDMEMTPVDFAAEFVVRCSYNLSSILGLIQFGPAVLE
jgi:thioester reductase-like protein